MSKLDDILIYAAEHEEYLYYSKDGANPEFKQQIKDLFLELIGEELHDCPPDCTPEMHEENDVRNQLKLELRQKVSEL